MRVERREVVPNDRLHVAFRLPVDETDEFIACGGGARLHRRPRDLAAGAPAGAPRADRARRARHRVGLRRRRLAGLRRARRRARHRRRRRSRPPSSRSSTGFLEHGPTEVELEASLAQSERSWLSALASQEERADLISHHLLLHDDPDVVNTHLDRLRDVTAEQVVDAARRWLRPESRAVGRLPRRRDADDADDADAGTATSRGRRVSAPRPDVTPPRRRGPSPCPPSTCSATACACSRTTCPASTCSRCGSSCPPPCPTSPPARRASAR